MYAYSKALGLLGLPHALIECAEGKIPAPIVTLEAPPGWYGHPPALIPIWSDGSGPTYIGYWKHWFIKREPCFVQMYVDSQRFTIEIARTVEQLFRVIAMMTIVADDEVRPDLEKFAKEVGLHNLQELVDVSVRTGDNPKGFIQIEAFQISTPLESCNIENYKGDFPTGHFAYYHPWWTKSCSFEVPAEILHSWPHDVKLPPWLDNALPKVELFNEYLGKSQLDKAWLTLNSTGWLIADAKTALADLCAQVNDLVFTAQAAAWLAVADETAGSY